MINVEQGILYVVRWDHGDKSLSESAVEGDTIKVVLKDGARHGFEGGAVTGILESVSFSLLQVATDGGTVPIGFGDIEDIIRL